VSVNQWNGQGEILGHVYERIVNGGVTVRVLFTHGVADNTGTLPVWFFRVQTEFGPGI